MKDYKLNTKVKLCERFSGVKGYCGFCGRPVFNRKGNFAKEGLCVYCYDMRKEGFIDGYDKGLIDGLEK